MTMTPTEKDAMALAVLAQAANECEAVGIADADAELERHWAQEISQARAHLASRIAELEGELEVQREQNRLGAARELEFLDRATRAEAELAAVREDAERRLALIVRIRDDKSWRSNDNSLWPDIVDAARGGD